MLYPESAKVLIHQSFQRRKHFNEIKNQTAIQENIKINHSRGVSGNEFDIQDFFNQYSLDDKLKNQANLIGEESIPVL